MRFNFFLICAIFFMLCSSAAAKTANNEGAKKLLLKRVNDYRSGGEVLSALRWLEHTQYKPEDFNIVSAANSSYLSANGEKIIVDVIQVNSDAAAYALLSRVRAGGQFSNSGNLGTKGLTAQQNNAVAFYKGTAYFFVFTPSSQQSNTNETLISFANTLSATLDSGTGEIPVLVKHLPDWETAEERAVYAVTLPALKEIMPDQPVLDAVSFAGGTEAVAATYDQGARLLIVEYATPQLAFDGDAAITARIAQLRSEGKEVPTAYRRVGNYSVFVFGAPDEQSAVQLIGKVKYEKDVRWLGENPYAVERANRAWLNMSTSVIVNTVKVTGLAIVVCLSIGGIFGGVVFMRRRAQAALAQTFSDAGGMMRLNLDETTPQHNPARLMGQGDK